MKIMCEQSLKLWTNQDKSYLYLRHTVHHQSQNIILSLLQADVLFFLNLFYCNEWQDLNLLILPLSIINFLYSMHNNLNPQHIEVSTNLLKFCTACRDAVKHIVRQNKQLI